MLRIAWIMDEIFAQISPRTSPTTRNPAAGGEA
jgi:hypothetical protein